MENVNPPPLGPLSIGNVVNAGVRIYRSHLGNYLSASFVAFLWLFVPVYGWAKYSAVHGTIARHAFQELINQPESLDESRRHANRRMWGFMGIGFLTILILFGLYIAFALVLAFVVGVSAISVAVSPTLTVIPVLVTIVGVVVGIFAIIRFYARIFIAEVPYTMESQVDEAGSISRSWSLTKGAVGRIQWIVVVAFLITLLLQLPAQVVAILAQVAAVNQEIETARILSVLNLAFSIVSGALILPYWQVIKAVIYYDLRTRREGLGLQLRDR